MKNKQSENKKGFLEIKSIIFEVTKEKLNNCLGTPELTIWMRNLHIPPRTRSKKIKKIKRWKT